MREGANGGIGMDFIIGLITQSEQPEFCSGQLSGPQGQLNFQDGRGPGWSVANPIPLAQELAAVQ